MTRERHGSAERAGRATHLIDLTAALSALAAVVLGVIAGWGSPAWWALPLMIVAVATAERFSVSMVVGRQAFVFALNDAVVAVALVLAPGAWIAVAYVLAIALARARTPWVKLRFNLAMHAVCVAAAVVVTQELGGGLLAVCAGLLVFYGLNHLSSRCRWH